MTIFDIIIIAFILSLDAFSVSVSCGIKLGKNNRLKYHKIAITFGMFQALMPLGGLLLGKLIKDFVGSYAHFISFSIFFLLGLKTFYEVFKDHKENKTTICQCENPVCLFNLAVATSIDAFLIGVVLSFYNDVSFFISLPLIGITTIIMSYTGCHIGNAANQIFKRWSQILAGIILIVLAVKSLY